MFPLFLSRPVAAVRAMVCIVILYMNKGKQFKVCKCNQWKYKVKWNGYVVEWHLTFSHFQHHRRHILEMLKKQDQHNTILSKILFAFNLFHIS